VRIGCRAIPANNNLQHQISIPVHTMAGVNGMNKEDEKKPITWEAADPKLPVVQSGHMENRCQNQTE